LVLVGLGAQEAQLAVLLAVQVDNLCSAQSVLLVGVAVVATILVTVPLGLPVVQVVVVLPAADQVALGQQTRGVMVVQVVAVQRMAVVAVVVPMLPVRVVQVEQPVTVVTV